MPVSSVSSVGIGPLPTRVMYALYTPTTSETAIGPRPAPTPAPAAVEDGTDDVT
jgi:hypothetical protein